MICNMNGRETCLTKKCFYDFYNFFLRYPTWGTHFSKIKNYEPSEKNSYKIQFWQNVQNTMRDGRKVYTWPSCMIMLLFYFISSILWSISKKYPTCGTIPLHILCYLKRTRNFHLPIIEQIFFELDLQCTVFGNTSLGLAIRVFFSPNHKIYEKWHAEFRKSYVKFPVSYLGLPCTTSPARHEIRSRKVNLLEDVCACEIKR